MLRRQLPFLVQTKPVYPVVQVHLKLPSSSLEQTPPFWQGDTSHGRTREINII